MTGRQDSETAVSVAVQGQSLTGLRYVLLAVFMNLLRRVWIQEERLRKSFSNCRLQTDRRSYCPGKETLTREASNKLWPTTFYLRLKDIGFSNRKREKGKNEEKTSSLSVSL